MTLNDEQLHNLGLELEFEPGRSRVNSITYRPIMKSLLETIVALRRANKELRDVAEFYGDEENWEQTSQGYVGGLALYIDGGQRARKALER